MILRDGETKEGLMREFLALAERCGGEVYWDLDSISMRADGYKIEWRHKGSCTGPAWSCHWGSEHQSRGRGDTPEEALRDAALKARTALGRSGDVVRAMEAAQLPTKPAEPKPPAELVEFAERHGVEVERAAAANRFCASVRNVEVFGSAGKQLEPCASNSKHVRYGDTIDEALANLAAATVDDEEAHLEVCGLIGDVRKVFSPPQWTRLGGDGQEWWLREAGPDAIKGGHAKSPWLAVIEMQKSMHDLAGWSFKVEEACREWRKTNA